MSKEILVNHSTSGWSYKSTTGDRGGQNSLFNKSITNYKMPTYLALQHTQLCTYLQGRKWEIRRCRGWVCFPFTQQISTKLKLARYMKFWIWTTLECLENQGEVYQNNVYNSKTIHRYGKTCSTPMLTITYYKLSTKGNGPCRKSTRNRISNYA